MLTANQVRKSVASWLEEQTLDKGNAKRLVTVYNKYLKKSKNREEAANKLFKDLEGYRKMLREGYLDGQGNIKPKFVEKGINEDTIFEAWLKKKGY
jgi:hypothetical protein